VIRRGQYTCPRCGMSGHTTPSCHVEARGAEGPDEHDRLAQELVPSPGHSGNVPIGDVRRIIAALLRSGGKLEST
jgi:hypothetical protein